MSKPTFEAKPNGTFLFSWQEEKLIITASRIQEHSGGVIKGEILIKTTLPPFDHIHGPRTFTYSSTRSQAELAKFLTSKYQCEQWNWIDILEQCSTTLISAIREGEPLKELDSQTDFEPVEFILEPWIIKGYPNVIFGDAEAGKTTIGVFAQICMTLPYIENDVGIVAPPLPVNCIYLDWENDYVAIHRTFKKIITGQDLPSMKLSYQNLNGQPFANSLEKIFNLIEYKRAQAIIIDSLGPAVGPGGLNKDEPALAFYQALGKLKITSLILAQTSKDPDKKVSSIFGSIFYRYLNRNCFEVRSQKDGSRIRCGFWHEKSNYTERHKPFGIEITHFRDEIKFSECELTIEEWGERLGYEVQILEMLKTGKKTIKEIAAMLGCNYPTASSTLNKLKGRKKIISIERGTFGLPSKEEINV